MTTRSFKNMRQHDYVTPKVNSLVAVRSKRIDTARLGLWASSSGCVLISILAIVLVVH